METWCKRKCFWSHQVKNEPTWI